VDPIERAVFSPGPSADGLLRQGWYDGAESAKPCLQFFNRLPRTLQAQAQSEPGLALSDAPPGLVQRWLALPLIAAIGAGDAPLGHGLRFQLRTFEEEGSVGVIVDRSDGSRWSRGIRVPRRRANASR
jgi:hypothetical protein